MFQSDTSRFVTYLREALLPERYCERKFLKHEGFFWGKEWSEKALHIQLDVDMTDPDNRCDEDGNSRGFRGMIHFILCGNTTVFAYLGEFTERFNEIDPSEFENISNHDSCWRESIHCFVNDIYFKWADQLAPDKAPKDLNTNCYLGCFTQHQFVKVEYHSAEDHRYNLVSVEPWKDEPKT